MLPRIAANLPSLAGFQFGEVALFQSYGFAFHDPKGEMVRNPALLVTGEFVFLVMPDQLLDVERCARLNQRPACATAQDKGGAVDHVEPRPLPVQR